MIYHIYNIHWDTDGENFRKLGLPQEVKIEAEEDKNGNCPTDTVNDFLSDKYGYLVISYRFESALTEEQSKLKMFLEDHGYKIHLFLQDNAVCAEIENWTKRDEDMIVTLLSFSLENLKDVIENYDIDEHIETMMQDKNYKAHFSYQEAIEDQKDWLKGWKDTLDTFEGRTPKEDTITVTLTASEQKRIIDLLFGEKENASVELKDATPSEQAVMQTYIDNIDKLIKKLSL